MNQLLAKTKGANGKYYIVISSQAIFSLPDDLVNHKEYDSDYKLEDDEWFYIENFSTKDYCGDFILRRFISPEYDQIDVEDFKNIDHICAYQTGVYYFQKLSSSQVVRKKYFTLSITPQLVVDEPIIVIDEKADAIYNKNEDVLYFKKLTIISSIFKGIEVLYREATEEETEAFLQNDFIKLENDYTARQVKKTNRKRIALAMAKLESYSPEDKDSILSYIRGYCSDLDYDEETSKFAISNEEELKKLLYGIDQRYYTTLIGDEKRLANSIITL